MVRNDGRSGLVPAGQLALVAGLREVHARELSAGEHAALVAGGDGSVEPPLLVTRSSEASGSWHVRVSENGRRATFTLAEGRWATFDEVFVADDDRLPPAIADLLGCGPFDAAAIEGATLTLSLRAYASSADWRALALRIKRSWLASCASGVESRTLVHRSPVTPAEGEMTETLRRVIEQRVNPLLAEHAGAVRLARVRGSEVWLTLTGACQGCGAAGLTLRSTIQREIRAALPDISAIHDETDHGAPTGSHPARERPRLSRFVVKLRTEAIDQPAPARFYLNGSLRSFDYASGRLARGQRLELGALVNAVPEQLSLAGPERGAWAIGWMTVELSPASGDPYVVRLGPITLDARTSVNLWRLRPVISFSV